MKRNEIIILESLISRSKTLKELAKDLNLSESYASELTDALSEMNFIKKEKRGKFTYISIIEPKDIYLKKISDSFSLKLLLSGKKDILLPRLLIPKKITDLETQTSKSQIYKDISELKSLGVILENKGEYCINPDLGDLVNLLNIMEKQALYKGVKEYAIVLWRKGSERLEKIPEGFNIEEKREGEKEGERKGEEGEEEGELTAFSRFSDYGIEYTPAHNYVFYQKKQGKKQGKKLLPEEIFIHSLIASEKKAQLSISIIFFLKNRDKLNIASIKKLARHYDVLNLYLDVEHYLTAKKGDKFLPWGEFLEKAKLYDINLDKQFKGEILFSVLVEIGKIINEEINVYLIGGGNMIIQGLKDSTKDIDLVVENIDDFYILKDGLETLGYGEHSKAMELYKNLKPSTIMYKSENPRFDIFVKKVCGVIELSDTMKSNALFFKKYGKIKVNLISPEGIFIFKSITDREGDLEDVVSIAKKYSLNWKLIFEEVIRQEEKSKKRFSFALLDTLEILKERYNIVSPIIKKLRTHCLEEAIIIAVDKPRNIRELKELIDFPMSQISSAVRRLEKRHKIIVDRSKKPATISKRED